MAITADTLVAVAVINESDVEDQENRYDIPVIMEKLLFTQALLD